MADYQLKYTGDEVDKLLSKVDTPSQSVSDDTKSVISPKGVKETTDKLQLREDGKGLSTNDFDNESLQKLKDCATREYVDQKIQESITNVLSDSY